MEKFGFFFGFYGLILGLAVTELLSGLGAVVRADELKKLGAQTGLLALFVLLVICATWIDAWESLRGVSLDFAGLWAPLVIAILYYLIATIVFPHDPTEWPSMDDYFARRKRSVGLLLLVNECVVNYSYLPRLEDIYSHDRSAFWHWEVPYNIAIKVLFIVFIFVRGRRSNIAMLVAMILLFLLPYWHHAQTG